MKHLTVMLYAVAVAGSLSLVISGCDSGGGDDDPATPATTTTTTVAAGTTTTTTVPGALVAPTQTAPASGSTLTSFPRNLTLTWTSVPGAASYGLQIQMNMGSWVDVVNTTLAATTYSTTMSGDNPCRWRVWAIDAASNAGPYSGWATFEFDTSP